jgi:hypothetical protein
MPADQQPQTLADAHEFLWQTRPKRDADPLKWAAFYRHSAQVYAATAKIDLRHRHEATQCAGLEMRKALDIEHRLNSHGDDA